MDAPRFDHWARAIATARSRRGAIGFLMAGALAGMAGSESIAKNKGKGKDKKKGCKKSEKKCGKKCIPKFFDCCSDKDCDRCALEKCLDGVCQCDIPGPRSFGVCGVAPDCLPAGFATPDAFSCCSQNAVNAGNGQLGCLPGKFECITSVDCVSGGIDACRGFMCPELYHARTGDTCS